MASALAQGLLVLDLQDSRVSESERFPDLLVQTLLHLSSTFQWHGFGTFDYTNNTEALWTWAVPSHYKVNIRHLGHIIQNHAKTCGQRTRTDSHCLFPLLVIHQLLLVIADQLRSCFLLLTLSLGSAKLLPTIQG